MPNSFLSFYRYEKLEGKQFSIADAEYFVFHSPYNKVYILRTCDRAIDLSFWFTIEILNVFLFLLK